MAYIQFRAKKKKTKTKTTTKLVNYMYQHPT